MAVGAASEAGGVSVAVGSKGVLKVGATGVSGAKVAVGEMEVGDKARVAEGNGVTGSGWAVIGIGVGLGGATAGMGGVTLFAITGGGATVGMTGIDARKVNTKATRTPDRTKMSTLTQPMSQNHTRVLS